MLSYIVAYACGDGEMIVAPPAGNARHQDYYIGVANLAHSRLVTARHANREEGYLAAFESLGSPPLSLRF
jgi:hypothetical protein